MRKSGPVPKPIPLAWKPLIEEHLNQLIASGQSPASVLQRREKITHLARQLDPTTPRAVTGKQLCAWLAGERVRRNWARETHRSYRMAISRFFQWAHAAGHIATDPAVELPVVKPDQPKPRPTPSRVWKAAKLAADSRVMLMMRLAAEAGLRRGEIAQVHTRDLRDDYEGALLLVHGKGAKERVVPITDELADLIAAGAAGHTPGAPREGWLFPGRRGQHLSAKRVGEVCSQAMPDIWTVHTLRHLFASNAYRGTRNLRAVQELLGHSSVGTTQRYLAVEDHETRAAMMAAAQAS
jgi:integrase